MPRTYDQAVSTRYHIYNSLFLNLPYTGIYRTGTLLPLLQQTCEEGFEKKGKDPKAIVKKFFSDYAPKATKEEQRAEKLARQQEREARYKLHQEKLASRTTGASHGQHPQILLREPEQTAWREEGLGHHNRANQHSETSRKSLSGNYDALGI